MSNHSIMGFDFPLMLEGLYRETGIYLRVLADHSHFQVRRAGTHMATPTTLSGGVHSREFSTSPPHWRSSRSDPPHLTYSPTHPLTH